MRIVRAILAPLFAVLFVVAANSCLIAAVVPGIAEACCEQEGTGAEGQPCSGDDCVPCLTLENGVNLSSLVPASLPAPIFAEDAMFAALLRERVADATLEPQYAHGTPEPLPPPWSGVVKKAVPVRGPAVLA